MFKKLSIALVLAVLLLVGTANVYALYGLEKYWGSVVDEDGTVRTDISSVTVYDQGTTTVATVYSDDTGSSLTNPITTGLSDGVFEFYTSASSVDIVVTDGARSKKESTWTTSSQHQITLIAQIGEQKVMRFGPADFLVMNNAEDTVVVPSTSSQPTLEYNNKTIALVWSDGPESYAQVTFKVPQDYESSGAFRVLTDYNTGAAHPQIRYRVFVNSDGSAWDTAATAQDAVDPAGTVGSPELTNLPIATDFASLSAGDVVTFQISRDNQEAGVTADLELYYGEFYYDAKQ